MTTIDDDIGELDSTLLFLPSFDGSLRQCYQVAITDDDIIEEDELFKISLRRIPDVTPSNVRFDIPEATVRIIDNDSKSNSYIRTAEPQVRSGARVDPELSIGIFWLTIK